MSGQTHTPAVSSSSVAVTPPAMSGGTQDQRQNQVGNASVQAGTQSTPGTPAGPASPGTCTDAVHLPNPVAATGDPSYYECRANDFTTRYADCALAAPSYYISYGKKYITRFTLETSPRLTPEGQAWLRRAAVNLQVAIENRRGADALDFDRLEKNDALFTSFAYSTHADAYWSAGLGDLGLFDLSNIGLTPDVRDLLARDGLAQVADIGTRLMGTWGTSAIDFAAGDGTTEQLVDAAYEGYAVVGDDIDLVFGPGTTAALEDGASVLRTGAGELANGAYDIAADQVRGGVTQVDSVMGSGWTESTVDSARETASDASDYVEEQYDSAGEWAEEVWDAFAF